MPTRVEVAVRASTTNIAGYPDAARISITNQASRRYVACRQKFHSTVIITTRHSSFKTRPIHLERTTVPIVLQVSLMPGLRIFYVDQNFIHHYPVPNAFAHSSSVLTHNHQNKQQHTSKKPGPKISANSNQFDSLAGLPETVGSEQARKKQGKPSKNRNQGSKGMATSPHVPVQSPTNHRNMPSNVTSDRAAPPQHVRGRKAVHGTSRGGGRGRDRGGLTSPNDHLTKEKPHFLHGLNSVFQFGSTSGHSSNPEGLPFKGLELLGVEIRGGVLFDGQNQSRVDLSSALMAEKTE
nr:hypothetical protein Iba_chr04cCG9220 [Ipomoea batatas]